MIKNNLKIDFEIENLKISLHNNGDCHHNAKLLFKSLKNLNYNVRLVKGIYVNPPKSIRHSWVESKDKILETDCQQLREPGDIMPNKKWAILDKVKFKHRYKAL